jgi:hypothetical protein
MAGQACPNASHQEDDAMAIEWKLKGSYFETCNCEAACPCNFLGPPTEGTCTALAGWHIDEGAFAGTRLDGLNVALVAHSPGHMLHTKWKVALYLDDRANQAQSEALAQIYSGKAGGLMEQLSGFIGEVAGVRNVPITFKSEGRKRSLRVGDLALADIEAIDGAGGGDTVIHNPPLNLAPGEPLVVARSKRYRVADYGMSVEVSNRNGFYAPFTYTPA